MFLISLLKNTFEKVIILSSFIHLIPPPPSECEKLRRSRFPKRILRGILAQIWATVASNTSESGDELSSRVWREVWGGSMAGARNISYLFSRLHDAFSAGGVTPPRLEINRRTIEKTWKLMDKAGCVHWHIVDKMGGKRVFCLSYILWFIWDMTSANFAQYGWPQFPV